MFSTTRPNIPEGSNFCGHRRVNFNYHTCRLLFCCTTLYEGCPESIQAFWISREPVAWPGCNLAASQKGPYCASVNSHSPVGLVSRQGDAVDWACVLCDRRIHDDRSRQYCYPFYSSLTGFFFWQNFASPRSLSTPKAHIWLPATFGIFPKLKSPVKVRRLVNATVTRYTSSVNGVLLPTD